MVAHGWQGNAAGEMDRADKFSSELFQASFRLVGPGLVDRVAASALLGYSSQSLKEHNKTIKGEKGIYAHVIQPCGRARSPWLSSYQPYGP